MGSISSSRRPDGPSRGRKLYVEMTFAVVKAAEGDTLGSVAMARDVTERVEREPAARPS